MSRYATEIANAGQQATLPIFGDRGMSLSAALLSWPWLLLGGLLYAGMLAVALWRAPWYHLRDPDALQVLLVSCVALMLMWGLSAEATPGLRYHFIGASLLTLMFGWQFALIGVGVVALASTIVGDSGWAAGGWNASLASGAVVTSALWLRWTQAHMPDNYFIYILVGAFFGGVLGMVSVALLSSALLAVAGPWSGDWLLANHLTTFLLMLFPEGFLTGMLMTIFVVYKPHWVCSFDDNRYLRGK